MTTDVIFDTDAGNDIDDLYALALILKLPQLNLLGVTTVSNDTQARARLVAKMLRLAGRADVPVYAGIRVPEAMRARGLTEANYKQRLTHCDFVTVDDPEHGRQYGDAVTFMLNRLRQATRPITLIGTGTWSNIAEVLRRADEQQKGMIASVALMGGEIRLLLVESNTGGDPEAVDVIFKSGVPVFVATWSVSRQLDFSMAEVKALTSDSTSPFVQALRTTTELWWGDGAVYKPGPVCYDVIPVFWAAGERDHISCLKLESLPVELTGTLTRGMFVIHPWKLMKPEPAADVSPDYLTLTDNIDAVALKQRYIELVFGVGAGV